MKILVIGPSWVGDMVMSQSLLICLRQRHPACDIDVLAPPWCGELSSRMPEVRRSLPLPIGHGELALGKRREIAASLRQERYDQAIVLPNSFKSALIPRFAGVPLRTGWRGEARGLLLNDCRRLDKSVYPLMVQRFAALAFEAGAPLPEALPRPALASDSGARAALCERLGLDAGRSTIVLCPGAEYGPAKQWPARHYAVLAAMLLRDGHQVWMLGSAKDGTVAAQIREAQETSLRGDCHNLCGQTTLGEAIDLMSGVTAVVSNDSGLMHVASALARPVVVIYGSTSPGFTPPLGERVKHVSLNLSCSPCFKRECPLQHLDCLNKLEPQKAYSALEELLQ